MRLYVTGFDKGDWCPITYETKDMAAFQRDNLAERGIFYSVNSFDATKEELAKAGFATKRNKPFLKELWYCFGDLDICKEDDDTTVEQREAKKQAMINALMDHCEPTLIVATKNGIQPLWKLRNSEITPEYLEKYESAEMGIIKWSIQYGGKGDEVKDTTRVLRMPGFYHQKGKEKYIVKTVYSSDVTYTIEELMEIFPYEKPIKTYDPTMSDRDSDPRLDQLDFRHIIKHAFHSVGKTCEFDEKGEVVINGRVTGNFQGKTGDRRFIAGQSHDDFRGNVITATGKIIGKNDKETFEWILREFGLWEEELPPPQIPKSMQRKDVRVQQEQLIKAPKFELVSFDKILDEAEDEIKNFDPNSVISFGYKFLDEALGGIFLSDLVLIGGITGTGKTTLSVRIAEKAALRGHKVIIAVLEDRLGTRAKREVLYRVNKARRVSQKPYIKLKDFLLNPSLISRDEWTAGRAALSTANIQFVRVNAQLRPEDLEELYTNKADLFVIDHLHYFSVHEKNVNKADSIEKAMQTIKNLTSRYDTRTVLVAHFLKLDETKRPTQTDFKDSMSIAQTADTTILLWRDKSFDPNKSETENAKRQYITEFISPKNRVDEPAITVEAVFDRYTNDYSEDKELVSTRMGTRNAPQREQKGKELSEAERQLKQMAIDAIS
jgi:replicative DNA helicase